MTTFTWLLLASISMSAIALVGSVTLVLRKSTLQKIPLPLVAFAAGTLIGCALFHMIPASLLAMPAVTSLGWVAVGFSLFFTIEQFLHWHHCHRASADCRKPFTYLFLVGDALHDFLGGLARGANRNHIGTGPGADILGLSTRDTSTTSAMAASNTKRVIASRSIAWE